MVGVGESFRVPKTSLNENLSRRSRGYGAAGIGIMSIR